MAQCQDLCGYCGHLNCGVGRGACGSAAPAWDSFPGEESCKLTKIDPPWLCGWEGQDGLPTVCPSDGDPWGSGWL